MENEVLFLKHYWSQIGPSDVTFRIFMKEYFRGKKKTWSLAKKARYFWFKHFEGIRFYSTIRQIISFNKVIQYDDKMLLSRDYDQKTPYTSLMSSVTQMGKVTHSSYRPFEYYDVIQHLEQQKASKDELPPLRPSSSS